ncbi:MAG: sensor histidine kinase [Bacteroidota bacterium]
MRTFRSANIKLSLLVAAVIIVLGTLVYTEQLVKQLLQKEHDVAAVYAKSLEFIANSPPEQTDYSFIFDQLVRQIDFPMVLTDGNNEPVQPYHSATRNITYDSTLSPDKIRALLKSHIEEMDTRNTPIKVVTKTGAVLNYVHYGESELIRNLRYLPYYEIGVGGLFILIAYFGFSYIKRNEQSNIWVGMAKETAHQLGTPLSSLWAWVDVLKAHSEENPKQLETITDMENDLRRLQKVTDRFSKIGSKTNLKTEDIVTIIDSVIAYYKKRLPSVSQGKHVLISIAEPKESGNQIPVSINRELFEWVIENLIKNALDAIEGNGSIMFFIMLDGNSVIIDVKDTGKGIDMRSKQDIFRPGYSTKQRGWGLGLSLSKRIIEQYHKGKLFVKESKPGKGTTFRIKLKR